MLMMMGINVRRTIVEKKCHFLTIERKLKSAMGMCDNVSLKREVDAE